METDQVELRARGRLGTVLRGKYRLDSVIGVGGMAVVYKATHRNQAEFAVKMLHPELSLNDNIRSRFLREGYAANSVKHSGVVLVVDDDVAEDGAAFLVMELLSGLTADEAWTALGGRIPLAAACALAVELLDVLAAAHEKGIVHRDIKPANIFLTRDGVLKVLDFGIARVRDSMAGNSQATGTGMLLGTPAFMAPEQVIGKPSDIDARVDLWATGATIFNLVSGQMVHEADTGPMLMVKLATQPPRALHDVQPDAPPVIAAAVDRALAFDKNQRWQTAGEMEAALRAACVESFGDINTRAILAKLVGAAKPPGARAAPAPSAAQAVAPAPFGTPAPGPFGTPGFAPVGASGTAPGTGVRAVTGVSPISTSSAVYQSQPAAIPGSSRKGIVGIVAGVAVLAIAGGAVAVLHKGSPPPETPAAVVPSPTPQAASAQAPTQLAPIHNDVPAVVTPPPTPPPVAATHPEPANTAKRSSAAPGGRPGAASRDAGGASREGPSKPNCNPPYTLDVNGEKHFRPECF
jgi:tRNA A-37 threonylcarbamoyl transferase component Bud32